MTDKIRGGQTFRHQVVVRFVVFVVVDENYKFKKNLVRKSMEYLA